MAKNKSTVSPRWAKFCGWLLKRLGWTSDGGPMVEKKAIVLGVPHTTIWDFVVSYLFYTQFGKKARVMIKKEFFFWPVGPILRACGAVPVDRQSPATMVRSLISEMESVDEFHLAIAHLIARETGSTVYMGYFDWGTKHISVGEKIELTDDVKADMQRIYDHYRPMGLQGKHKDGFIVP